MVGVGVDLDDLVGVGGLEWDGVGLRVGVEDLAGVRVACGDLVGVTGTQPPHVEEVYPGLHTPAKNGVQEVYPTGQGTVGGGVRVLERSKVVECDAPADSAGVAETDVVATPLP